MPRLFKEISFRALDTTFFSIQMGWRRHIRYNVSCGERIFSKSQNKSRESTHLRTGRKFCCISNCPNYRSTGTTSKPIPDRAYPSNTSRRSLQCNTKEQAHPNPARYIQKPRENKRKSSIHNMGSVMNTRYGRSDRIRTCGLMVPNHPLYQLSHTPEGFSIISQAAKKSIEKFLKKYLTSKFDFGIITQSCERHAGVAQPVERLTCNQ